MISPSEFREDADKVLAAVRKHGRDATNFATCIYYNVNMNDDKKKAELESSDFLLKYYREDPSAIIDKWVAYGTRKDCVDKIEKFVSAGANEFSIRFVAWNQIDQLRRFSDEVLPSF